jgi:hypothetical protein
LRASSAEKKDELLRTRLDRRRISVAAGGIVERTIPYGRFALIEPRGSIFGYVVVAPEYVLMQRAAHTSIRDISYLAVWSEERSRAIARELSALAEDGTGVVAAGTPEVLTILRAIAPVSTPLFVGGGECHRTLRAFTRRQLDAELRAAARQDNAVTAGRKAS